MPESPILPAAGQAGNIGQPPRGFVLHQGLSEKMVGGRFFSPYNHPGTYNMNFGQPRQYARRLNIQDDWMTGQMVPTKIR